MRLTLQLDTESHDALMRDHQTFTEFLGWLKTTPDPLAQDCTRMDLLDESGTLFRCTHWARDDAGRLIIDGEPCPEGSIHPTGERCHWCENRRLREAVTEIATDRPLPVSVLRYLTSLAEGTTP